MTSERITELRRLASEQTAGLVQTDTNPWTLLEEALDALVPLVEFVDMIRQPVGDMTEALDELERQQAQ